MHFSIVSLRHSRLEAKVTLQLVSRVVDTVIGNLADARTRFLCIILYINATGLNFYRATACNATHGIAVAILSVCLSVRLSVRPSVRSVYCDKTKQRTANILIPHETAITLVS